jgi:hypothetical protein
VTIIVGLASGFGRLLTQALYQRIRDSIDASSAWTSRTSRRVVVAAIVVAVSSAAVLFVASEVVYGQQGPALVFGSHERSRMLVMLALMIGLALVSGLVAIERGCDGMGFGVVPLLLVVGLVTPIYAFLALHSLEHVSNPSVASVYISSWGTRCLVVAAIVGGLALASFTRRCVERCPLQVGFAGPRSVRHPAPGQDSSSLFFVRPTSFGTCLSGTQCQLLRSCLLAASRRPVFSDLDALPCVDASSRNS